MKHTYIKIYNQARQEVGLPGPSPEEAAVAERLTSILENLQRIESKTKLRKKRAIIRHDYFYDI